VVSFTSGETDPSIHCVGSWVGPGAGLDFIEVISLILIPISFLAFSTDILRSIFFLYDE
jgi:hypothetical protein